jgi:hypothetical protein
MEIGIKGFKGVRFEAGNFIIKSDAIEIETGKKVIVQAVQKPDGSLSRNTSAPAEEGLKLGIGRLGEK